MGNFASSRLTYSPIDEINTIIKNKNTISLEDLLVPYKVYLIIRTGGKPTRLSNFLPIQSGYAAIHIVNDYFIDLNIKILSEIIDEYRLVDMNFGK